MREHIGIFDAQGWEIIHTLACPGDLLACEVTQAARELVAPPGGMVGRFEVFASTTKHGPKLKLGKTVGPDAGLGFSKRTGYSYKRSDLLPKGVELMPWTRSARGIPFYHKVQGEASPAEIIAWLRSPEGEAWSQLCLSRVQRYFSHTGRCGAFAELTDPGELGSSHHSYHPIPEEELRALMHLGQYAPFLYEPEKLPVGLSCPA